MTEREAFIAAIAASPGEQTARLAFADYLQEHGEDDRAAFVRLTCAVAALLAAHPPDAPPEAEIRPLRDEAHALLEQGWRRWLEPFLAALGCEETGPPPKRGWAGRLWDRVAGGPRVTNFQPDIHRGDVADLFDGGNGPVRCYGFGEGLIERLDIDFGSPFPVRDFAAALRLEPVIGLTLSVRSNPAMWRRLDVPCLSRVVGLRLETPAEHSARHAATFTDLAFGGNWAGLRALHAWCPAGGWMAVPQAVPHGYVRQLADAPLLSGLSRLYVTVAAADLPLLTRSPHARSLREFRAWSCRLPPAAAAVVGDAVFRPNLEALDLSINELGDAGARSLAAVEWPNLRSLRLGGNALTDAGVRDLLPLVRQLTDLGLADEQITDAGARLLADALDPERLESLDLGYNPLSERAVAGLRERFGRRFRFRTRDDPGELQQFP